MLLKKMNRVAKLVFSSDVVPEISEDRCVEDYHHQASHYDESDLCSWVKIFHFTPEMKL